jgi:RimJ/RimL family protein N-acetyltransferase
MIIDNYNISLVQLNTSHLEDLRNWRNSVYVQTQMLFTDYITKEMQSNWYATLDKSKNYYFIAYSDSLPFGVIHIKEISNNEGEGGIFLINQSFENTDLVARLIVSFNDFVFYKLNIKCLYSHVRSSNKKAIASSIAQGCIKNSEKSTPEVIYFELFRENYERKVLKIKKIIR